MNHDVPALIAASLLSASPARGRAVPVRTVPMDRWGNLISYPRYRAIAPTHADGPRADRRAEASPSVRPPLRLSPFQRAFVARHLSERALGMCRRRDAAQTAAREPFTTTERHYAGKLVFRSRRGTTR